MKTELKHLLNTPLTVANKGEQELVYELLLKAPTAKARPLIIRLRQLFLSALTSLKQDSSKEEPEQAQQGEMTAKQVIGLLYLSNVDILLFHDLMRDVLLIPGIVTVGDVKFTGHLYDQLELDDLESVMGEYFASFLAPSLMKSLMG